MYASQALVGELGGATICMMRNLEIERVVLAAMAVGIGRRSLEVMNNYANERKAFGSHLSSFGQIQRHIGESYAEYMAGKTYLYQVAPAFTPAPALTLPLPLPLPLTLT